MEVNKRRKCTKAGKGNSFPVFCSTPGCETHSILIPDMSPFSRRSCLLILHKDVSFK